MKESTIPLARPVTGSLDSPLAQPTAAPIAKPIHQPARANAPAVPVNAMTSDPAPATSDEVSYEDLDEGSWIAENLPMVLGMIALLTVSAGIVILAVSGVTFDFNRQSAPDVVVTSSGTDGVRTTSQPTIVDASKASLRREGVKVSVRRLRYDHLWTRDESNVVHRTPTKKLILEVRLNNQYDQMRGFAGWRPREVEGPHLTDSSDRSYPLSTETYHRVMGRYEGRTLPPGEVIRDILIFEAPDGFSFEGIDWFRIKLPGDVFEVEGDYWFRVPPKLFDAPATQDAPPPLWMEEIPEGEVESSQSSPPSTDNSNSLNE